MNPKQHRAAVDELYRSGTDPPEIDEQKIFEKLDDFAHNPTGLREWLEELAAEAPEWASMALQSLKFRYSDLHRLLKKQDGGGVKWKEVLQVLCIAVSLLQALVVSSQLEGFYLHTSKLQIAS